MPAKNVLTVAEKLKKEKEKYKISPDIIALSLFAGAAVIILLMLFSGLDITFPVLKHKAGYDLFLFDKKGTFYQDDGYPQEIKNKRDSEVIGMKCTGYEKEKSIEKVAEEVIGTKQYTKNVGQVPLLSIRALSVCETEQEDAIALFSAYAGSGIEFFEIGYIRNEKLYPAAWIENQNGFSNCFNPLFLTSGNEFNFQCNYQTPPRSGAAIYSANLNTGEITHVYECEQNAKYGYRCFKNSDK